MSFLDLISQKIQTILVISGLFVLIAVGYTLVQPRKFVAQADLLVIQIFPAGTDPFAVSRANVYISTLLSQAIETQAFYRDVMDSGYKIDKEHFYDQSGGIFLLNKWMTTVEARAISDNGLVRLRVFHADKFQAEQIVNSIIYTLKTKNTNYQGSGDKVVVKVVNDPFVSERPSEPNILKNLLIGIVFGSVTAFVFVLLFPEKRYNLYLLRSAKQEGYRPGYDRADLVRDAHKETFPSAESNTKELSEYQPKDLQKINYPERTEEMVDRRHETVLNKQNTEFKGDIKNLLQN